MAFSRIKASIEQAVENSIRTGVTRIAEDAKKNSSWSADIPDAIYVGDVKKESSGVWSGEIIVDLKKAPQAAAFEYGSGIHGEEGEEYIIEPDTAPALAFPKSKWPGYNPPPKAPEVFVFPFVMHPGVAAKPYLRPAIEKDRKAIRTLILNGFIKGYKDGIDVKVIIK